MRALSERHIDDVSPGIECELSLLEKSEVLYVIPKFENRSISENLSWCKEILGLNKTLGMHGVYHTYYEFAEERNESYLNEGMKIFEQCFGFKPEYFRPPQLKISKENKRLVKSLGMNFEGYGSTIFHKGYHCNDSGRLSNKFMDFF